LLSEAPYPANSTGFIRLNAAAALAGMSPGFLAACIDRGEVPVSMKRYGANGLRLLHKAQFDTWLAGEEPNLFGDIQ
jgi:hypothetical protein